MAHDCEHCSKWIEICDAESGVCERKAQYNYLLNVKNKGLSTKEFIDVIFDSITCWDESCMFWAGAKCDM